MDRRTEAEEARTLMALARTGTLARPSAIAQRRAKNPTTVRAKCW